MFVSRAARISSKIANNLKTMTKTLQAVLAPLMISGSFSGFGLFEYPLGNPRPYLSCLYVLVILGFPSYFDYYPRYYRFFFMKETDPRSWIDFLILILAITSISVSFFYFKVCKHFISTHI